MSKVCEICGTEYASDAEYCNLCKKESLIEVPDAPLPPAPRERLIADPATLVFVSILWILGLGYLLAEFRPRSMSVLMLVWAGLSAMTWAVGFTMRNQRMAAIFSLIGLLFCALYALLLLPR